MMRAMEPSLARVPSMSGGGHRVEVEAGFLRGRGEELGDRIGDHEREGVTAEPRDGLRQDRHRVFLVQERTVPGATLGGQPHPAQALLGGLER